MALRQPPNPKHTTDRHETDYERWLKDHDDHYQPEGKPQYHPSDVESTTQNGDDDEIDDTTPGEEDTTTKTKAKTKINVSHGYAENVHVDDDGAVVRVSRYGSIMYPSKHDAVSMGAANHLGTGAGVSMDHTFLRVEQRESMVCCGISTFFMVIFLVGLGWGFRRNRQQRQRHQRGQHIDGISSDRSTSEKKDFMETV